MVIQTIVIHCGLVYNWMKFICWMKFTCKTFHSDTAFWIENCANDVIQLVFKSSTRDHPDTGSGWCHRHSTGGQNLSATCLEESGWQLKGPSLLSPLGGEVRPHCGSCDGAEEVYTFKDEILASILSTSSPPDTPLSLLDRKHTWMCVNGLHRSKETRWWSGGFPRVFHYLYKTSTKITFLAHTTLAEGGGLSCRSLITFHLICNMSQNEFGLK